MKLTIKRASDGAVVEVEGSQEECLATVQAVLGFNLQPQVVTIPTVWPSTPMPDLYRQPAQPPPWPVIIWGEGVCPWGNGTLLMPYQYNKNYCADDQSQPAGYRVESVGINAKLVPLSQSEVLTAMGVTFSSSGYQTNEGRTFLPANTFDSLAPAGGARG
jgi:hypothetical protein